MATKGVGDPAHFFGPEGGYRDVYFVISLFVMLCICVLSIVSDLIF